MSNKLSKLATADDNICIHRYDNGWMVEICGRDKNDEYATAKILCNTEDDAIAIFKEYNVMKG